MYQFQMIGQCCPNISFGCGFARSVVCITGKNGIIALVHTQVIVREDSLFENLFNQVEQAGRFFNQSVSRGLINLKAMLFKEFDDTFDRHGVDIT